MKEQFLFGRDWSLAVGVPGSKGKEYTRLKTTFEIFKDHTSNSNKSKIEIYNLSPESRQFYKKTDPKNLRQALQVQLQAGYIGTKKTIYIGDVRLVDHERKGPDVITKFECGTAEKSLLLSHFEQSYPPGTHVYQIFLDLVKALDVDVGPIVNLPNFVYNQAFVAKSSVKTMLDRLCAKHELIWSIQNGNIQIYPRSGHIGQQAIVLSNKEVPSKGIKPTGLLGVPSKNLGIVKFSSLLDPNLVPGVVVQIYSTNIDGDFFRINKAKFSGDSHGEKWQAECEAAPIKAKQVFNFAKGFDFSKAVMVA